eukprot:scaffold138537_cov70-Cyclotella_meneghiniana.AAC.1
MKPAAPVMSITESAVSAGLLFVLVLGAALALDDNGSMLSMKGSSSVSSAGATKTRLVRRRSVSVNAAVIDGSGGFTRRRAMVAVRYAQWSGMRNGESQWPILLEGFSSQILNSAPNNTFTSHISTTIDHGRLERRLH